MALGALVAIGCGGGGSSDSASPGSGVAVVIQRDAYGVAHIESSTDAGAYFGAGYAAAEDRFFAMSLSRRAYQGRLAQVLGPGEGGLYVGRDRQARLFGWRRHAQEQTATLASLNPAVHALLTAYAAGVNRYLAEVAADPKRSLHPFFEGIPNVLAPLSAEPWTVADCIGTWNRFGAFFQEFATGEHELRDQVDGLLASGLSETEVLNVLFPFDIVDDGAAVVSQSDVPPGLQAAMAEFALLNGFDASLSTGMSQGTVEPHFSQAWAATGAATAEGGVPGRAVLVGDPRVTLAAPNSFYEWHMRGATFDVRGIGVPGSPNTIVGSTPAVAWSVTAMGTDQADLYRLTVDATSAPWRYLVDGVWQSMEEYPEEVLVWSFVDEEASPAVFDRPLLHRRTVFGPLVTEWLGVAVKDEHALMAVPFAQPLVASHAAFYAMARAQDVPSFRAALADWNFPSVNAIFAGRGDRSDPSAPDLVGYQANGAQPVRVPLFMAGRMALDGDSVGKLWQTYVPHDLKPWVLKDGSDDDGVVFSGNHLPVGTWYPLPRPTVVLGHTDRSRRLAELLSPGEPLTVAAMDTIRRDTVRPSARDIVRLGLMMRDQAGAALSAGSSAALDVLGAWFAAGAGIDRNTSGSALASFLPGGFIPEIPTHQPLAATWGRGPAGLSAYLIARLAALELDPQLQLDSSEVAFVVAALEAALASVSGPSGAGTADPAAWDAWYEASQLTAGIALWVTPEGINLQQGVQPHAALFGVDVPTLFSQSGETYTQIVRVGVDDGATSVLAPGSVEPGRSSPHELDQLGLWVTGGLKPSPTSAAGIEALGPTTVRILTY